MRRKYLQPFCNPILAHFKQKKVKTPQIGPRQALNGPITTEETMLSTYRATERLEDSSMSSPQTKYAARPEDVLALIREHSFAWVVSAAPGFRATPLPLRPRLDASGELDGFIGHFARSNPQVDEIRQSGRALLLFMGTHGYISASWMRERTQAPTWNYMAAQFDCRVTMIDDAEGVANCLDELIGSMEEGRSNAWSMNEMGERAGRLARGVVGFHADIIAAKSVFKLGQDERNDVFADILLGLAQEAGSAPLAGHMKRYNAERS
jgi:transcriptional regulator